MKLCDITIAYNEKSGGIRTYIDAKRAYLERETEHEHLLIVPGEEDRVVRDGRLTTIQIAGPLLPNQNDYRFFLTPAKIKDALLAEQPDVVELGSYYVEPWAAFSYRKRRLEAGAPTVLGGYFHTDVAEAYVASPLKAAAHEWLDDVSEALGAVAEKIADVAASGAESYIRYVFRHCDVAMAAAPPQAERLRAYGVDDIEIVPMGVDLDTFNPSRRCMKTRAALGACEDQLVLIYAGRLSTEKRVLTLVEAFERMKHHGAQLWIMGEGPLHEELETIAARMPTLKVLPYENDRARFAALLASADLYVTAGPHETFGLSVIEAQASGLPVIGVDAGALRERVTEGLGFLVPVDDAAAMAENITRAAQDRAAISARARAHVERQFNWNTTFDALTALYQARLDAQAPAAKRVRKRPARTRARLAALLGA